MAVSARTVRTTYGVRSLGDFESSPGFSRQYSNVYYSRLQLLGPKLNPKWSEPKVRRVLDLIPGQPSWLIGTLFREVASLPSIIDDLAKINHGMMPEGNSSYYSKEDRVFLEDDHGQIEIVGVQEHCSTIVVTGCVVAVKGSQDSQGVFHVTGLSFPDYQFPPPLIPKRSPRPRKVALVSGLLLDESEHESVGHQLLIDFLAGSLQPELSADISCLIICGNSLTEPKQSLVGSRVLRPSTSLSALSALDEYLYQLGRLVPVHIMPGPSDPTTVAFPQRSLHHALFKTSRPLLQGDNHSKILNLETNPQIFDFDGTVVLGTSGQPVMDLRKYGDASPLDILEYTLKWRHMAPTAPDTLSSFPYPDSDPMVMVATPHVYFAGNMPEFATETRLGVRLISVPEFSKTQSLVTLDLDTLDVHTVEFGPHALA